MLQEANWRPEVYQQLLKLLENPGSNAYAVFDFDNTLSFFDIEDSLMMYLVDNMLLKISSQRLYEILANPFYQIDQELLPLPASPSLHDLVLDIIDLYQELKQFGDQSLETASLHQSFTAKMRYYYLYVKANIQPQVGQAWLTYWYEGYDLATFQALVNEMLANYARSTITYRTWSSHPAHSGRTGSVTVSFEEGVRISQDMVNLLACLREHSVTPYIISASPQVLVQAAAAYYQLPVDIDNIYGMDLMINEFQQISPLLRPGSFLTKYQGKADLITDCILPNHQGQAPLLVAGDSSGDYDMLTRFDGLGLGLIIDRGDTGPLANLYTRENQAYLVQGRDEFQARLIPSQHSLLLQ